MIEVLRGGGDWTLNKVLSSFKSESAVRDEHSAESVHNRELCTLHTTHFVTTPQTLTRHCGLAVQHLSHAQTIHFHRGEHSVLHNANKCVGVCVKTSTFIHKSICACFGSICGLFGGFFCSSLRVGTLEYLTLCYICMMFDLEMSPEFFGPKQKCLWWSRVLRGLTLVWKVG